MKTSRSLRTQAVAKRNLKRELKTFYECPSDEVGVVHVPAAPFLAVDGRGDPNTSLDYAAAIEALFGVAYAVKFAVKKGPRAVDFGVMPLEGLWWADDWRAFTTGAKDDWRWTMMIRQPEFVTEALVAEARAGVTRRKKSDRADAIELRFFEEGPCAQILHVGPFTAEGPTIERLHAGIAAAGGRRTGKHHEIYLSDIRRAQPAKWRTILRQPFASAAEALPGAARAGKPGN